MKIKLFLIAASYTLLIAACAESRINDEPVNNAASLPPDFNFSKHGFKVVNTLINKKAGTMSTLYGNNIAVRSYKTGVQQNSPGMALALVTWKQQPNPYWFGNNIPGALLSVEMLTADRNTRAINYSLFEGKRLALNANPKQAGQRKSFILAQKPSVMP